MEIKAIPTRIEISDDKEIFCEIWKTAPGTFAIKVNKQIFTKQEWSQTAKEIEIAFDLLNGVYQ